MYLCRTARARRWWEAGALAIRKNLYISIYLGLKGYRLTLHLEHDAGEKQVHKLYIKNIYILSLSHFISMYLYLYLYLYVYICIYVAQLEHDAGVKQVH